MTHAQIHIQAFVEAPFHSSDRPWPWPVAERNSSSILLVPGTITDLEVGGVFAQLAKYNRIDGGVSSDVLDRIVAAENLLLPGGLQVASSTGQTIEPGCCYGLETWRDWPRFLQTGQSPWLGHDPSPRLEWIGDTVRVWSDGGMDPVPDAFWIDIDRLTFERELAEVQRDLVAFLKRIEQWAGNLGFPAPERLSAKFDQSFHITEEQA
jgi:hypothetical protein